MGTFIDYWNVEYGNICNRDIVHAHLGLILLCVDYWDYTHCAMTVNSQFCKWLSEFVSWIILCIRCCEIITCLKTFILYLYALFLFSILLPAEPLCSGSVWRPVLRRSNMFLYKLGTSTDEQVVSIAEHIVKIN